MFKYRYLQELGRTDRMLEIARRDYDAFAGYALERYFYWKFAEDAAYTRMGAWWDRKGENEIDLVCEDEVSGQLDFYEIKTDPRRIDLVALRRKADAFFAKNPTFRGRPCRYAALSLADM